MFVDFECDAWQERLSQICNTRWSAHCIQVKCDFYHFRRKIFFHLFRSFGQRIISFWSESISLHLSKNLFLPFSEVPWQDLAKRGRDRNLEQTLSLNVEMLTQKVLTESTLCQINGKGKDKTVMRGCDRNPLTTSTTQETRFQGSRIFPFQPICLKPHNMKAKKMQDMCQSEKMWSSVKNRPKQSSELEEK